MRVLVEGAVRVDDLDAPISIRRYRDDKREQWAEATIDRGGELWTFRFHVGMRSLGFWEKGRDYSRTGGPAPIKLADNEAVDALPKRYRVAMRTLVFGLAKMVFDE